MFRKIKQSQQSARLKEYLKILRKSAATASVERSSEGDYP
jgi:hypothetical protein